MPSFSPFGTASGEAAAAVVNESSLGLVDAAAMLQPDVLLPAQLLSTPARMLTAERRLMVAILSDAIWCFQRYCSATSSQGRRLYREAERWLLVRDWSWMFSFERICETLDLDAAQVRSGLRRWKEQQQSGSTPSPRVRPSVPMRAMPPPSRHGPSYDGQA
jgi:hypothetical protein